MGYHFPPLGEGGFDNPGDWLSLMHLTAEALAERFQLCESPAIWNEIERRFWRWRERFIRTLRARLRATCARLARRTARGRPDDARGLAEVYGQSLDCARRF